MTDLFLPGAEPPTSDSPSETALHPSYLRDGSVLVEVFSPLGAGGARALRAYDAMLLQLLRAVQPLPEGFAHFPVVFYGEGAYRADRAYAAVAFAAGRGAPPVLVRRLGSRLPREWRRVRDPGWLPAKLALDRCGAAWVDAETLDRQGWPSTAPPRRDPAERVEVRALTEGPLTDYPFPGRVSREGARPSVAPPALTLVPRPTPST